MRAFTNTQVSKEQLLKNIRKHKEAEAFQKGNYWDEEGETGCSIGCSIHDFEPGMESNHAAYEGLFGIPAELAVLEDSLFERMERDENLGRWPEEFISSIPEGADLDRAAGRWLLKLLEHPESPFEHAQGRKCIQTTREVLRHWTQTGEKEPELAGLAQEALETTHRTDHSSEVAEQIARYITYRTRTEPYTTTEMLLLDSICGFMTASYANNQKGVPQDNAFESPKQECLDKLSRMLLETLQENLQE